jgi:hypothetical protein
MKSPKRPTSLFRSFSTKSTRLAWIIGAVAISATLLFATYSLAGTVGPSVFSRAASVVGGRPGAGGAAAAAAGP